MWIKKLKEMLYGSNTREMNGITSVEKSDGTVIQTKDGDEQLLEELRKKHGENVIGYAPPSRNVKYTAGEATDRPAHQILVKKKKSKSKLKSDEIIPETMGGTETDVIEIGEVKALGVTKRFRPLKIGPSIGNITITAGTPGGPAQFEEGVGWCTNSHVACETMRKDLSAQERKCVQPGKVDQGKYPDDYVGYVRKAYIIPEGYTAYNDFAFVLADKLELFKEPLIYDMELPWLEPVTSSDMKAGDGLWKPITRTTDLKTGQVISVGATISVNYGKDGTIIHKDCLVSTVMSAGGDSGSWCGRLVEGDETRENLMRDVNRHPTTYLFAGSSTTTIHHDIVGAMFGMSIQPYVPSDIQPPEENKIRVDFILEKSGNGMEYEIYGTVIDKNNDPIEKCQMVLKDSSGEQRTTETNLNGKYRYSLVSPGAYALTASAEGYASQTKEVDVGETQSFRLKNARRKA